MAAGALGLLLVCILFAFPAALDSAMVDCSSLLMLNLAACLPFMAPGSMMQKPEEKCCLGLKAVLEIGTECLCDAFNNSVPLGVTIDVTMALTLPLVCHFSNLSITHCSLNIGTSPAYSPPASSLPPTATLGVNKAAPAPAPHSSSSSSLTAALELLVLPMVTTVLSSNVL